MAHWLKWKSGMIVLAFAMVSALAIGSSAHGAGVKATFGFDGWFRPGSWSPVRVEIESGVAPFAGELVLKVPRTTLRSVTPSYVYVRLPVSLDAGARAVHWFTLPLVESPHLFELLLLSSGGGAADHAAFSLRSGAVAGPIVLILDPEKRSWSWISAASGQREQTAPTAFAYASHPTELPDDPLALSALTAIVMVSEFPAAALSPGQVKALRRYVEYGGNLVLVGGPTPPAFGAAWSWLPFAVSSAVGHIDAVDGTKAPAWLLADRPPGSEPGLIHSASYGAGHVILFAANPLHPGVRALEPAEVWAAALERPLPLARPGQFLPADEEIWRLLESSPVATKLPNGVLAAVWGYLGLTVILLIWGRQRRLAFAFLPPAIVAGCWILVWQTSAPALRDRVAATEAQLGFGVTEGLIVNRSYLTVATTAPRPARLDLATPPPAPFPAGYDLSRDVVLHRTAAGVSVERLAFGAPLHFVHESIEELPVFASRSPERERTYYIMNNSPYALEYAYIVERDRYYALGTLTPGARRAFSPPPGVRPGRAGWVPLAIQGELERMERSVRPTRLESGLLVLAASRGLDDSIYFGRRDEPLLVALVRSPGVFALSPPSYERRVRAVVLPIPVGLPPWAQGGDGT